MKERILTALVNATSCSEKVPPDGALGRVCAETVLSGRDVPAVSVSAMDGYALRSAETRIASPSNPVRFNLNGSLLPGQKESSKLQRLGAFYVATGAPIPRGADAVVKAEETRLSGDRVVILRSVPKGKNIVFQGEDVCAGEVIIERGRIMRPADIALLISARRGSVSVFRCRVGVLSIGDDLTESAGDEGKTVNNYSNLICGYLSEMGVDPLPLGIVSDDPVQIQNTIKTGIDELDAAITIGGNSVGENDKTPSSFQDGLVFHGIRLLPIKPTGLAMMRRKPVILLPGHAVSVALSFFLVALPVLNIMSSLGFDSRIAAVKARMAKRFLNSHAVDALYLVRLRGSGGEYEASPLGWGSNVISNLAKANGFVRVASGQVVEKGEEITVNLLGAPETSRIAK